MFQITEATSFVQTWTRHSFHDNHVLVEALDTTGLSRAESNQRLAMLGDKALGMALIDDWRVTGEPKVTAMLILNNVASNVNLGEVASKAGLGLHIKANPGQVGPVSRKTLATTVEAVLGAIWEDSGKDIQAVKTAMMNMGLNTDG